MVDHTHIGTAIIVQTDGGMVPVVDVDPTQSDKRKGKMLRWQEAKLCLAHPHGSNTLNFGGTLLRNVDTVGQPFETRSASCAHLQSAYASADNNDNIQCLPLMAYVELLGIVVLEADMVRDPQESMEIEGNRRFALEQVGLSIGNLKLRESLRQGTL